jgi:hypothetical protein
VEFTVRTSGIIDLKLSSFEQQLERIITKLRTSERKSQTWDKIEPKMTFLNEKVSNLKKKSLKNTLHETSRQKHRPYEK